MPKQKTPKPDTEGKLIAEFGKNSSEIVRIQLVQYKDQELLDVRVWVLRDEKNYVPTKKGISLRVNQIEDLKQAIDKAAKEVESEKEAKEKCWQTK